MARPRSYPTPRLAFLSGQKLFQPPTNFVLYSYNRTFPVPHHDYYILFEGEGWRGKTFAFTSGVAGRQEEEEEERKKPLLFTSSGKYFPFPSACLAVRGIVTYCQSLFAEIPPLQLT